MQLIINSHANGIGVVQPVGSLDHRFAREFSDCLAAVIAGGMGRLVVDLAEVTFVDSSGLGALIGGLQAARRAGGDLRLARAPAQVRYLFERTTLDRIVTIYPSVAAALSGYHGCPEARPAPSQEAPLPGAR
jgi:anti-sigma B factor antagonist